MKFLSPISNERGAIILTVLVLWMVVGGTLYLFKEAVQTQENCKTEYYRRLANNEPISEELEKCALNATKNQFNIAGGTASLISATDVNPDKGSVGATYIMEGYGRAVNYASDSRQQRPNKDKLLPADVKKALDECGSRLFKCANGKAICADLVCNRQNNCGDNSDEGAFCNNDTTCCVATKGCPGETGSSCADTCCCCPYGQVCDRQNFSNGCISAQ
jgi:hypothetical protein